MKQLAVTVVVLAAVVAVTAAAAARKPTYVEKATIMDAFNIPGRAFPSKCVLIRVSTANPRYAVLTSPAHYPRACTRTGAVGDGFVLFKRASASAAHWRDILEGPRNCSSRPPHISGVPLSVRRDLQRWLC